MRVAAFLRYGRLGASSRVRCYQLLPVLERVGLTVETFPLLDNYYLRRKYATGGTSRLAVSKGYLRRVRDVLSERHRFDVAFVEKELFPYLPATLELPFLTHGPPVVLDYDDATYESYRTNALLRDKIGRLMDEAAAVTVGSRNLESYARRFNDHVTLVPSVVDPSRYAPRTDYETTGPVTIGWIGTPMTQPLLEPAIEALAVVARERALRLVLVGASPETRVPGVETVVSKWREHEEAEQIRAFDVGIMPVTDTPFHRGKCGYKLVQYMAAGIPTVASPVGANEDLTLEGGTGFLARTTEEWVAHLRALIDSAELRRRMGERGRRRVDEELSIEHAGAKLAEVLRAVVATG